MPKTIGVLTGGGDVPGLNTVIQQLTLRAEKGYRVIGIKRGWGGLVYMDPKSEPNSDHFEELTPNKVRIIDRTGGTILHTSRVNPLKVESDRVFEEYKGFSFEGKRDFTDDVIKNLDKMNIDVLVTIGGDDTLSYSRHLMSLGRKVIGIPKTMDGDVCGTDYCIGFATAITRANTNITRLRSSCGSHERIGVFEEFGRHSGLTALYSAVVAKVDRVLIPEVPFDMDRVIELTIRDYRENPSKYAILLVAEGAKEIAGEELFKGEKQDGYGHKKLGGIGYIIAGEFKKTGFETVENPITYLLRSGEPDAKDKLYATVFADLSIDAISKGHTGTLTAIKDGKPTLVPLEITKNSPFKVDVERFYDTEQYRPKVSGFIDSCLIL